MSDRRAATPSAVVESAVAAINRRDLTAFLARFEADYRSEQPRHPERNFIGLERVKRNWRSNLEAMADLRWDLLNVAVSGDQVMAELVWSGTRVTGERWLEQGVIVYTVRDDRISAGRVYMEPVD